MEEMTKHGQAGVAAMRAGMDPKTARKYVRDGKLPSELVEPRDWRTHEDAFLEHWPELEAMLAESPAFEAKTLFEVLVGKYPGRYEEGQLRTLQRRVKSWRAERGERRRIKGHSGRWSPSPQATQVDEGDGLHQETSHRAHPSWLRAG